jgi:deoxyribodipyrimidine photo-lyase
MTVVSALRAQFLIECLGDLKRNLQKRGLDLLIRHGKPEDVLPSIVKSVSAHTVRLSAQPYP